MKPRAGAYAAVVFAAISWGTWPLLLRWAARYGPLEATLEAAVVIAVVTALMMPLAIRDWRRADDPGVGDARHEPRLVDHPFMRIRVAADVAERLAKRLHDDRHTKHFVLGEPDFAHAALAEAAPHFVVADAGSGGGHSGVAYA